jgi:hypothetical protein
MLVKLPLARPYRPLPPWQAIGARTCLHSELWTVLSLHRGV